MKNNKKNLILILFVSFILALILSKFVGGLVYVFFKPVTGLGPQLQCPECFDGFIINYLFFISLLVCLFKFNKKNKFWFILFLPIILFINPPFEFLIISLIFIFVAWLLAKIILIIYKMVKK
ncbi:MAG: hypothetical protein ABH830_03625 [Patescibacteria group bacterium]